MKSVDVTYSNLKTTSSYTHFREDPEISFLSGHRFESRIDLESNHNPNPIIKTELNQIVPKQSRS